jgi:hypothetical protein
MAPMHAARTRSWTRLAVVGVAMAVLSGCTPQIVDGEAVKDATYQPSRQGEAAANRTLPEPPKVVYPKTDRPTENPGVGLGVSTHPPTDFSLIPGS